MTLARASFLFLCFHLIGPLLYKPSDAALSSSILQVINCSTSGNYTTSSAYAANVNQFLAALPENAISRNGGFFNGTVGVGPDTVYGLALCPADYSRADCGDCLTGATASSADGLPSRCPGSTTVVAMFDRCLIRYSNVDFFGTPEIGIVQALSGLTLTTSNPGLYSPKVAQSFKERIAEAIASPQRFSASAADPYTFVQCTWDLSADKCKQCLVALSDNASNVIAIRMDGQRKSYSCTVRYSNTSYMVVPFTAVSSGPTPQSVDQTGTSSPPSSASSSKAIIGGAAAAAVVGLICLAALIWYVYKLRRQRNTTVHVRKFDYAQLASATRNFAARGQLGAGSFGAVYKGTIRVEGNEEDVAIKKIIDATLGRSRKEFDNEIRIMSPLNHRNVVKLVGWCNERNNLLLVYELMEMGNLEDQLYPKERATDSEIFRVTVPGTALQLDWPKRHNILLGIASGLVYLHSGCKECVVHRDIKPGNVMLDSAFNAKLCDFGLVTQVRHTQTSRSTNTICGTTMYVDPVYVTTHRVTDQSDVYSFGVVMLEVACGEKPVIEGTRNKLIEKVQQHYRRNDILHAVDRRLRGPFDEQIKRVLKIGLLCVQPDRHLRPHIRKVMDFLSHPETPLPPIPVTNQTLDTVSEGVSEASSPQPHRHNRNTQ